jgi:large conductance mechanosensitive channel
MLQEFKEFLIKDNALALAIGVIIGGAMSGLVKSITDDLIMPVVSLATSGIDGDWKAWTIPLGAAEGAPAIQLGNFLATLLNFVIIGFVVWRISKLFIKPAPAA